MNHTQAVSVLSIYIITIDFVNYILCWFSIYSDGSTAMQLDEVFVVQMYPTRVARTPPWW
jgi:hypothetical protein